MKRLAALILILLLGLVSSGRAQVERVWLTHQTHEPSKLVVNWTTKSPGDSLVQFGPSAAYGQEVHVSGNRKLHHVEIPLPEAGAALHYKVTTGDQSSSDATIRGYPTDVLRVAVVANWQSKPDLKALLEDDPHLLLTAGDNISNLWRDCGEGVKDCTKPYADLIDRYPSLFRSVPFLPALGNHDKEIRPRGPKPPAEPVYDIDATAFLAFFPLPGEGWKWHFDLPDFGLRFVALDLNHVSDFGTTWQTCHDFGVDSEQFQWYRQIMEGRSPEFVVTVSNEKNATIRRLEKGAWAPLLHQGTLSISGNGYFGEWAEVDGFSYWNTSLRGKGAKSPDPGSKVLKSENNYLLLTLEKGAGTMSVELKSLSGDVLVRREYQAPH